MVSSLENDRHHRTDLRAEMLLKMKNEIFVMEQRMNSMREESENEQFVRSNLFNSIQGKCNSFSERLRQLVDEYLSNEMNVDSLLTNEAEFESSWALANDYGLTESFFDRISCELGHRIVAIVDTVSSNKSINQKMIPARIFTFLKQYMSKLLDKYVQRRCNEILGEARAQFSSNDCLMETHTIMAHEDNVEGSLFYYHPCEISSAAQWVVTYVDELVSESIKMSSMKQTLIDQSDRYLQCIKTLCRLYNVLIPSKYRNQIVQNSHICQVHFNDCMYLCQILTKYSVACNLHFKNATDDSSNSSFIDCIRELRATGERTYHLLPQSKRTTLSPFINSS